ncbi:MAG: hypothetical protein ACOYXY_19800 [Thermodesulfobacteriota bacterium]
MEKDKAKQRSGWKLFREEAQLTFDRFLKIVEIPAELTLDATISSEPLQRIPVVGGLIAAAKLGASVRDFFLAAKMKRFLDGISDETLQKLKDKLRTDEGFRVKATQKILLLLDRFADLEKASILAKIVTFFANDDIDKNTLERLFDAVDKLFVQDISVLVDFYNLQGDTHKFIEAYSESLQNLAMSGLVGLGLQDGSGFVSDYDKFNPNRTGVTLVMILQDGELPRRQFSAPDRHKQW